jgi:hypothetical protein
MQKKILKYTASELNKILDQQKYPAEAEEYLNMIAREFQEEGLKWVLLKAYCLGVINGKRKERTRRNL